uniref:Uncharacterized protein n=1 Tax=Noctiluca scintillans TaxID=2966 RepID=A0A7S1AB25_NOCSC|mmetsp:Transcript_39034/g.103718  ORF Transcript_39034/g.103718 Transcript_39034/m.103718 type:complete len:401 (+) Transcript_39034:110-1312(+)
MSLNVESLTQHTGEGLLTDQFDRQSFAEQIHELFIGSNPGSLRTDGTAQIEERNEPVPPVPPRKRLRTAILIMLAGGAAYDFFGKTIYELAPGSDAGVQGLMRDKWLSWLLTLVSFLAGAIPPIFSSENRNAFRGADANLYIKLVAPSFCDFFVTGSRFIALVFLPPSVVGIMKNSVQLLTVAFLSSMRGKKLAKVQWLSFLPQIAGDVVVGVASSMTGQSGSSKHGGKRVLGVLIVIGSGIMGGFRNIVEEMVLQDYDFPDGALLMAESLFSGVLVLIVGVVFALAFDQSGFLNMFGMVFTSPLIILCVVLFSVCSYGKDAGKLKLTKRASTVLTKVLCLVMPFGTWIISLVFFGISVVAKWEPRVGENWSSPWDEVRLAGFVLIMFGSVVFVRAKKKK